MQQRTVARASSRARGGRPHETCAPRRRRRPASLHRAIASPQRLASLPRCYATYAAALSALLAVRPDRAVRSSLARASRAPAVAANGSPSPSPPGTVRAGDESCSMGCLRPAPLPARPLAAPRPAALTAAAPIAAAAQGCRQRRAGAQLSSLPNVPAAPERAPAGPPHAEPPARGRAGPRQRRGHAWRRHVGGGAVWRRRRHARAGQPWPRLARRGAAPQHRRGRQRVWQPGTRRGPDGGRGRRSRAAVQAAPAGAGRRHHPRGRGQPQGRRQRPQRQRQAARRGRRGHGSGGRRGAARSSGAAAPSSGGGARVARLARA